MVQVLAISSKLGLEPPDISRETLATGIEPVSFLSENALTVRCTQPTCTSRETITYSIIKRTKNPPISQWVSQILLIYINIKD